MAIKITSTKRVITHVNCLVYGESGIGKTTLCGTAPSPLIVSVEGGLLTLADRDIPVIEISKDFTKSRAELNEIHEWLMKSKEAKKFKTVCVDSLSEEAEVILAEEMSLTTNGMRAYGQMADAMAISIRGYRDIPFHTCFTAKVRKIVDEATGTVKFYPSVPGQQLLNNLPYFFDEVFRMDFGKTPATKATPGHPAKPARKYRYIDTVGNRQYICKDRSGKLNAKELPNLTTIFNKILAKKPVVAKAPAVKPVVKSTKLIKPQEGK